MFSKFNCFPLQCLFPHGGAGRGHAVLPAEVWAAGQNTVRPPGQRQQADRQLRAEVKGHHNRASAMLSQLRFSIVS